MHRRRFIAALSASALLGSFALHATAADAPAPGAMQAVRLHEYGDAAVMKLEEAPCPAPAKGQMLVRVKAAGVNPVDWKIRSGKFRGMMPLVLPAILGYDVAGTVESVGEDVTKFKAGDQVYAYMPLTRGGGYAQYAVVGESEAAMKPEKADFEHAAAVPVAALTAYQALFDTAGLKAGQTVLIHAGAGGVGHLAIQLAKWKGATVIATASESNQAFLKELGADVVIDYKAVKFEDVAKNVDVVLDAVGGDTQDRSFGVLKKGGMLVSIVQPPSPQKAMEFGVRATVIMVQPNGAQLAEIAGLIDAGKVKPHVSDTFPLAEATKAHEKSETGRTRGKIVLTVP